MTEIKNVDRLLSRLNKIGQMNLKDTMDKATTIVHAQAKLLAPVDTGNLRGSIHMETKQQGKKLEGRVYTNAQYAPYVEFGTGIKGKGSYPYQIDGLELSYKENWQGMIAQPYMYPALKNNEEYIKKLFANGVRANLKSNCNGGK